MKMVKVSYWILFITILFSTAEYAYSQAYHFSVYSVNEGLPHAQVADVIESSDGYLWIGTSGAGVSRFDGHEFVTFTVNDGLRDDYISFLYEDSNQRIWASTYYGGVAFLEQNRFINPFEDHPINDVNVTFIDEAPDGNVWFGTYGNGLFIYDGNSLENITVADGLKDDIVWHVYWDESGDLYISTHEGLSVYDGSEFRNFDVHDGISGTKVFKTITDSEGKKWFATSSGVTVLDNGEFSSIEEINGRPLRYIYDILIASNGDIWIGTESDGLFRYRMGEYDHITKREGLSSNYIHRIIEDSDQKIWIATDENGLNRFEGEVFRVYNTSSGIPTNEILSLFKDRDNIVWFGTERGLTRFDGISFQTFELPATDPLKMDVWSIDQIENGNIIIVDYDHNILEFNGEEFRPFDPGVAMPEIYIYDILIDSKNHLWIGGEEGLLHFDGDVMTHFTVEDGLPGTLVYHIYEDREGFIWIGTNNGASRFDGANFHNILPEDGLSHYNVNYITEDTEGRIWFGTSGGITLYTPGDDGEIQGLQSFGHMHGMKLIETLFLWHDSENQIMWQGTNGGVQSLNMKHFDETGEMLIEHHRLTRFGIGVETTHKANFEMDGKLWFGSMNGLIVLDPSKIRPDVYIPRVYITDFLLNGTEPDWNSLEAYLEYDLGRKLLPDTSFPYGSNSYTFYFSGLDFSNPHNVEFRYRIDGLETEWNLPTRNRNTTYSNLGPGNYTFMVEARSGQGPWSEAAVYPFSVDKPYWMKVWFWLLMLLILIIAIAGIINSYTKRIERERLTTLVDERTSHLLQAIKEKEVLVKEIHHRVKNNLAMIIGLLELQATKSTDEAVVNTLRESILRIYSMSLVHEKLYSTDHLTYVDVDNYISDLIHVISHSLDLTRRNIEISKNIDSFTLSLDQGITCGLLINELVTNAVKHAFNGHENGKIGVDFTISDNQKSLIVTDNGIGLPDEFAGFEHDGHIEGLSLGLTLIKTLAKQLNGNISTIPREIGTQIKITF